jgi:hypothetical protein
MRRTALAVGALAVAAVGGVTTASNSLPTTSTAGYTSVSVTGATMSSVTYTVMGSSITGFTMQLAGSQLLKTATASFNGAAPVACVMGVYDVTTAQTSLSCNGFVQPANRSWRLSVTVS